MKEILRIVNELQSTNSKNDKQEIISRNLDNRDFVGIMKFLLNDFILTGISKKKINKKVIISTTDNIINIFDAIDYLKENNTGKDYDIAVLNSFIDNGLNTDEEKDFYRQLITKNLKLGVSANTWNKLVENKNKIPVFDVMLAKKFADHKHKIKGDFVLTKKLDGTRIVVIKNNGKVKSYTRKGKEYIGLNQIEDEVKNLNIDNIVFDGELLADVKGNTNEVFTETLKKSRNKNKNKTGLVFNIFDMMSLNEFQNGKSINNAIERKEILSNLFNQNNFNYLIEVKPLYIGNDFSEIAKWTKYAEENEWEGIMVNMDKPYVCKRTDYLLKVKGMQSCDIKIVGFEEGEGRNKGRLGAIICEYKDNTVKVGSGYSDTQRDEIWNNQNEWLGRIIEVQYFEESKDSKTGLVSLRFPVFKYLRDIDKEVSYN